MIFKIIFTALLMAVCSQCAYQWRRYYVAYALKNQNTCLGFQLYPYSDSKNVYTCGISWTKNIQVKTQYLYLKLTKLGESDVVSLNGDFDEVDPKTEEPTGRKVTVKLYKDLKIFTLTAQNGTKEEEFCATIWKFPDPTAVDKDFKDMCAKDMQRISQTCY